ncbi:MAG TPA: T9SS type A sorting domain-containing protein, partial [Chitinophagales bacterium]|nr:T9SS type A sorting domain-containing protein [Chitinophagales bacterium]
TVLLVDSTVTSLQGRVSEQVSLLFPNPATQKVWVSTEGIISLRVYDLSGRLMLQKPINNNRSEIDVSQWPVGVYAVCLSGADTNKTIKLLKN